MSGLILLILSAVFVTADHSSFLKFFLHMTCATPQSPGIPPTSLATSSYSGWLSLELSSALLSFPLHPYSLGNRIQYDGFEYHI